MYNIKKITLKFFFSITHFNYSYQIISSQLLRFICSCLCAAFNIFLCKMWWPSEDLGAKTKAFGGLCLWELLISLNMSYEILKFEAIWPRLIFYRFVRISLSYVIKVSLLNTSRRQCLNKKIKILSYFLIVFN